MSSRSWPLAFLLGSLLLSCERSSTQPGPLRGGPPIEPAASSSNRIELPATVRRNLGIEFVTVEARRVENTLRVPGSFVYDADARREYHMALPGRIELHVAQYEVVERGDLLYRVQSPAWPGLLHEIVTGEQEISLARAEIDVAQAALTEARGGLVRLRERLRALASADFKAAELEARALDLEATLPRLGAEVRLAETRLANAQRTREHALHRASAAAELSEAELDARVVVNGREVPRYETLDWLEVRARSAGVVESLAATDGAYLEAPATVLRTVDPRALRFRALALQADLPRLLGSFEARLVPPGGNGFRAADSVPAEATLGLESHPEERTLVLLATPQAEAFWMRMGVSAFLELVFDSSERPTLAIPRSAVVRDGLVDVFFRRDPSDPNVVVRVEADLGPSDGRWVVVESGLTRGDQVVLAGAYELRLATSERGPADAGGHVHADGTTH